MLVHIVVEFEGHNVAIHIFIVPLEEVLRALASNDCSYTIVSRGMAFRWPFNDLYLVAGMRGHCSVGGIAMVGGVWLNHHAAEVAPHQEYCHKRWHVDVMCRLYDTLLAL